jgi:hypothetical protein
MQINHAFVSDDVHIFLSSDDFKMPLSGRRNLVSAFRNSRNIRVRRSAIVSMTVPAEHSGLQLEIETHLAVIDIDTLVCLASIPQLIDIRYAAVERGNFTDAFQSPNKTASKKRPQLY